MDVVVQLEDDVLQIEYRCHCVSGLQAKIANCWYKGGMTTSLGQKVRLQNEILRNRFCYFVIFSQVL